MGRVRRKEAPPHAEQFSFLMGCTGHGKDLVDF
jgi:hypothetical protein